MLASGCGSSAKTASAHSGSGTAQPATAAQYTAAVVKECHSIASDKALETKANAVSKQLGSDVTKFATLLKLTTPEYRQFYAIPAPDGDRAAAAFHRELKSLIAVSGALQAGVAAHQSTAALAQTVTSLETSLNRVVTDFKAFGVKCGAA